MSFSSEHKVEIVSQQIKSPCCKRALLSGILASRAYVSDEDDIVLSIDGAELLSFISVLVHEIYGTLAEISTSSVGGRRKLLRFSSPSALKYIKNFESGGEFCRFKCSSCKSFFFKGVFLASGSLSDPSKRYLLEFSLADRRERFFELFTECGLEPLLLERRKERLVYFKNSAMIEDFCALAGMNNAAFLIMNAKINGQIRNEVKRVANCETNNIDKAVNASMKQIAAIKALDGAGLLSSLPEELENTARLRMKYSDLSLAQLSQMAIPPISKPGLSHRLKKIIEIAEQRLGKEYIK